MWILLWLLMPHVWGALVRHRAGSSAPIPQAFQDATTPVYRRVCITYLIHAGGPQHLTMISIHCDNNCRRPSTAALQIGRAPSFGMKRGE
ncbi:hypothetical protein K431DRAFT_285436 [Polychaeton citri CBS 116435]|uniref:Uncharacterized protein n=1 Tax=Polychaeton citri CBS 116435 TaxID=1314669 RepID=A0A9P4Q536_9PEZI|nr:hypothetical protein K431DRAFT_285436 [Polychaeton citri CBS 116435]